MTPRKLGVLAKACDASLHLELITEVALLLALWVPVKSTSIAVFISLTVLQQILFPGTWNIISMLLLSATLTTTNTLVEFEILLSRVESCNHGHIVDGLPKGIEESPELLLLRVKLLSTSFT